MRSLLRFGWAAVGAPAPHRSWDYPVHFSWLPHVHLNLLSSTLHVPFVEGERPDVPYH